MIRKILLTLTVLLLLTALTAYHGWQWFKLNTGLKNLLLTKVHAVVGDDWHIEKMSFGFGTVSLEDVQLVYQDSPYQLDIRKVTLGYSFTSLLKGAVKPEKVAEEITIYHPRLTLHYNSRKQSENVNLRLDLSDNETERYRSLMKEYDFIKRITIRDGEILVLDEATREPTRLAKQINGWASTNEQGKAWIRMAGHIFNTDEYNTVIYGQLDLKRGGLDNINIDLHDYSITNQIPFLQPDYLEFQNGLVNGQLTVTERHEPDRGFDIAGNIQLENGQIKLESENLYFSDINIAAEIDNWNLKIKEAYQYINGTPTTLEGRIVNLIDPHLDLHLRSEQFDIARFVQEIQTEVNVPLYGTTQFDVAISEAIHAPKMSGFIAADSLYFGEKKIEDFRVDIDFEGRSVAFPRIFGKVEGGKITGRGRMDYIGGERQLNFDLNLSGDFARDLQQLGLPTVQRCVTVCDLSIFGTLSEPVGTGKLQLNLSNRLDKSVVLNGSVNFTRRTGLFISAVASEAEGFTITASIQDPVSQPTFDVEATNIENLLVFVNDPAVAFIRNHFAINMTADGNRNQMKVNLGGLRRHSYEKVFEIHAKSDDASVRQNYSGSLVLFPNIATLKSEGRFQVEMTDEAVNLTRLVIGDWLEADFSLPKSSDAARQGRVYLSGLKLPLLLSLLDQKTQNYDGDLYGQISLNGNAANPRYSGELWLLDGAFGEIRPVKGELSFLADAEKLQVKRLDFEDAGAMTFVSEGSYEFETRKLEALLASSNLDMNEVISLITGRRDIIQGKAMIQVAMNGQLPQIPLSGKVNVHNARILDFAFDEVVFDFGREEHSTGSYVSDAGFYSGKTSLTKQDEFVLNGTSFLPFSEEHTLDVQLSGKGNFLSILTDILPNLVKESGSQGHLKLTLSDWYTRPKFPDSRFTFENGFLRLSEVAREIEDLRGDLAISREDYFLDVDSLQGTIREQPFAISTTKSLFGLNNGVYDPLRVGGGDLNLGAILITTGPEGIPVNIPGVMEEGELGWFRLTGHDHGAAAGGNGVATEEPFFVTGPWERPSVRGKVYIQNANLIWPFDESAGNVNPIVKNIMNSIDWDVIAVANNDTRYEKQFSGVYVSMEVNKGDTLDFEGVLKDSTFTIAGKVESQRGQIEYFDLSFRVEKVGAEFNRSSLYPYVYGKAWTVVRDTSNVPQDVYLTLYSVDDVTRQEVTKGRYDRIRLKVSSQYTKYEGTQRETMATLGYSSETLDERARSAVGSSTDNFIFRPLFRPIERQLERKLGLDVVRFSYAVARNFLNSNFTNEQLSSSLALLRSSRLVLGKYLTEDIYIIYTGELKTDIDYQFSNEKGVGLQHIVGLEYRFNPQWLLQMEYDYNTLLQTHKQDKKIWLRHSFPF